MPYDSISVPLCLRNKARGETVCRAGEKLNEVEESGEPCSFIDGSYRFTYTGTCFLSSHALYVHFEGAMCDRCASLSTRALGCALLRRSHDGPKNMQKYTHYRFLSPTVPTAC